MYLGYNGSNNRFVVLLRRERFIHTRDIRVQEHPRSIVSGPVFNCLAKRSQKVQIYWCSAVLFKGPDCFLLINNFFG